MFTGAFIALFWSVIALIWAMSALVFILTINRGS